MTKRGALALDIASAMGRHLASAVSGIVTVAVVARVLGANRLGAWSVIGAAAFLVGLADMGLSTPLQRSALTGDAARTRRIFGFALAVVSLASPALVLGAFVVVLRTLSSPELARGEVVTAAAIALAGGLVGALGFPVRALLLVRGGVRHASASRAVGAVVQLVLTVGLTPWLRTLAAPSLALAVALVVETALLVSASRALAPDLLRGPSLRLERGELRAVAIEAGAPLATNVMVSLVQRLDVLVLAAIASLDVVAGYAVASRACDQGALLAKQTTNALAGRFGDLRERANAIRVGTAVMGVLASAVLVPLAVLGTPVLAMWAGPVAASPAIHRVLQILAAAGVVISAGIVAASALELTGRSPWLAARPTLVGSTVEVVVTTLGARHGGSAAIAFATVIGNAVVLGLVWRSAAAMLGWSSRDVARVVAPAVASTLASLVVALGLAPFAEGALAAFVACAVAGAAGVAVGGLAAWTQAPRAAGVAS